MREAGELAASGRLAEELDFAWFGNGEHVLFHNPTSSTLINLAFLAGVTERIRLLSCVLLAPLYPAALLAKMAASLAIVSDGRLELGVGVGGEYPAEFAACGVDVRERGARTDELLDVARELWSGEPVDHSGRFWRIHGTMEPAPATPPRVWVAGRSDAAVARAIRAGDVYMPYLLRPRRLRETIAQISDSPRAVPVIPYVLLHVDDDRERARRDAQQWVGHMYRQDPDKFHDLVIAGSADDCIYRLQELRDWGCEGVHLALICPADQWSDQPTTVGEAVLPAFASVP